MSLDPISETIAHFVGAFQLSEEAARLRIEYEKFVSARAIEDEAQRLELMGTRLKAPHDLEDYNPEISLALPAATITPLPFVAVGPVLRDVVTVNDAPLGEQAPDIGPALLSQSNLATIVYTVPPPSSLIAVTVQHNALSDNDQFSVTNLAAFQDLGAVVDLLALLQQQAAKLSPIEAGLSAFSSDWFALAREIQARAPTEVGGDASVLTVAVKTGVATEGIHVNGALVTEAHDWTDFKPAFVKAKEPVREEAASPEEEADAAEDADGPTTVITSVSSADSESDAAHHDFEKDFGELAPDLVPELGLEVVAGANLMVNETIITSAWLDGKVIAVGGDVLDYKAISQVNVLVDHDAVPFGVGVAPSTAVNIAEITTESAKPAPVTDAEIAEAAAQATGGQPQAWAVVRVEADVTQINWVQQYSFATDLDRAEVEVTGNGLYLGLGDNILSNLLDMLEIGFVYDLIIVGGNLIDMTLIQQTNVLLDSDVVAGSGQSPIEDAVPEAAAQPAGQGSVVVQEAQAVTETVTETQVVTETPVVTETQAVTDIETVTALPATPAEASAPAAAPGQQSGQVSQVVAAVPAAVADPALGDLLLADSIATDLPDTIAADGAAAETPVVPPVSTGDNLLVNQAAITTVGDDSIEAITETFNAAVDAFVAGATGVSSDVLAAEFFEGVDLLRVLYISGDFTTVNVLDQTNVLGDADQVHLAAANFAEQLGAQISLVTGSNILGNFASVTDRGVDSTIMSGGEVYSDALIHQANLIDTSDMPTAEGLASLTTEAVAFLADGLIDPNMSADIAADTHTAILGSFAHHEVMSNSMLS